jgi:hypothetical protein
MQLSQEGRRESTGRYDITTREGRARVRSALPKANGEGKSSVKVAYFWIDGAPLTMSAEGKSVCVSLVLLTNASRMEELQNLWNDTRVVTAGIWKVPPSNRESRSLKVSLTGISRCPKIVCT